MRCTQTEQQLLRHRNPDQSQAPAYEDLHAQSYRASFADVGPEIFECSAIDAIVTAYKGEGKTRIAIASFEVHQSSCLLNSMQGCTVQDVEPAISDKAVAATAKSAWATP